MGLKFADVPNGLAAITKVSDVGCGCDKRPTGTPISVAYFVKGNLGTPGKFQGNLG